MPNLLNEAVLKQVKDIFDTQLKQPVEVLFFGTSSEKMCLLLGHSPAC